MRPKTKTKRCDRCNKPFEADRRRTKYCSRSCARPPLNKPRIISCLNCHQSFHQSVAFQKFCSADCRKEFWRSNKKKSVSFTQHNKAVQHTTKPKLNQRTAQSKSFTQEPQIENAVKTKQKNKIQGRE